MRTEGGGKPAGIFTQAHDMKALVTPQKIEMQFIVIIHSMNGSIELDITKLTCSKNNLRQIYLDLRCAQQYFIKIIQL